MYKVCVVKTHLVQITDVFRADVGVQEWKVVRRRNSAFSEREREEMGVPAGMTASV